MEEVKDQGRKQWHPAFFAGIQIELAEDAHNLIFENEHQLSKKPMGIDVLIIKKCKDEPVRKNLGKIFKGHNVIEYKSPDDSLSVDDFYKVIGYACFYKSDVQNVDSIKADDITITFVSKSFPRQMIKHLKTVRKIEIVQFAKGIYYIFGGVFPMQLVVTSRLSKEENFWLRNLTNDLKAKEEAEEIVRAYQECKDSKLHQSVMDIIVRANEEQFKEVREGMCEALVELMQDVIDDIAEKRVEQARNLGKMEGRMAGLLEQIQKKLAKGKSVAQIADELEETVEKIQELIASLEV